MNESIIADGVTSIGAAVDSGLLGDPFPRTFVLRERDATEYSRRPMSSTDQYEKSVLSEHS